MYKARNLIAIACAVGAIALPALAFAQASISIQNCATPTVQDNGNGSFTLTCAGTTTTPGGADVAPQGCQISGPSSLSSTGGSLTLNAFCSQGNNLSYTWSRDQGGLTGVVSNASLVTSLPPNGTASPITYTYSVAISNSAGSQNPTKQVTVAAQTAGGGGGSCGAYGTTLDIPLSPLQRAGTQGFGNNAVAVGSFTTSADGTGYIVVSDNGDAYNTWRQAWISATPCGPALPSTSNPTGHYWFGMPGITAQYRIGSSSRAYVGLAGNTTYYLMVLNRYQDGALSCNAPDGTCEVYFEWH